MKMHRTCIGRTSGPLAALGFDHGYSQGIVDTSILRRKLKSESEVVSILLFLGDIDRA